MVVFAEVGEDVAGVLVFAEDHEGFIQEVDTACGMERVCESCIEYFDDGGRIQSKSPSGSTSLMSPFWSHDAFS